MLQSSQWFMTGTVIVFAVVGYHNIVAHWLPVVFINSCVGQQLCSRTALLVNSCADPQRIKLVLLFSERSSIRSK